MSDSRLIDEACAKLAAEGYVVIRQMVSDEERAQLLEIAYQQLSARAAPLELEADLHYPGAPDSRAAPGGETVRRLLGLFARHPAFSKWATSSPVRTLLEAYFGGPVRLSLAHHNSLMSKYPLYGTATGWHRDIRYWSFARDDLVSARLALGAEQASNGAIQLIPRSHRMRLARERFNDALFFREDLRENQALFEAAIDIELSAGDAVFFHCNTLHRAGKNLSDDVKLSLNFAYFGADNSPRPGTRSASHHSVLL
jgi:phytanoyl-CoA hydroxylase